jgi:hypothetical protein
LVLVLRAGGAGGALRGRSGVGTRCERDGGRDGRGGQCDEGSTRCAHAEFLRIPNDEVD